MKKQYLDLMEIVFGAYTNQHIKEYTESVKESGLKEHGFPRLTVNLGILIANGRKTELKEQFLEMMDLCCREIPVAHEKYGHSVGNDFSVKEVVLCILEIKKSDIFDKSVIDGWVDNLSKINPYDTYSVIAGQRPEPVGNWAAFGAASEVLRKFAKIGDETEFIERQIESQLPAFDINGMYRDPAEPIVYDLVTRLQLAVILFFGYDGKYRERLEEELKKSEEITLYMQSVTGEIPYGGRSNQFLHNEAFYAALCEFYAGWLNRRGEKDKAGIFKRAAKLAVNNMIKWLDRDSVSHIKNSFDFNSKFGCENYAYFDKYMITTGSWLYLAYIMADETVNEGICPFENENFVKETSEDFHKLFCKFGDYLVEYDTSADYHYDASGIGRIHKKDAPSAICLSVPFAKHPSYSIDIENPTPLSISGGIKTKEGIKYSFEEETEHKLIEKKVTGESSFISFECKTTTGDSFLEKIEVSNDGVNVIVEGDGDVEIVFPVFEFDGKIHSEISVSENYVNVIYNGFNCKYSSDNIIIDSNKTYANRNGHYRRMSVSGENKISLKIDINRI